MTTPTTDPVLYWNDVLLDLFRQVGGAIKDRDTLAGSRLHRLTQRRGRDLLQRRIETLSLRVWSGRDDHLPACVHKLRKRISERGRDRSGVVQNHERVVRDARRIDVDRRRRARAGRGRDRARGRAVAGDRGPDARSRRGFHADRGRARAASHGARESGRERQREARGQGEGAGLFRARVGPAAGRLPARAPRLLPRAVGESRRGARDPARRHALARPALQPGVHVGPARRTGARGRRY